MNRKKADIIWLGVSIFFLFILAISFLIMPLGSDTPSNDISVYTIISGSMFWISLIMEIITQFILSHRRKNWYVIHRVRKVRSTQKIGLISFFQNTYAAAADIVAIISLIGLIIAIVATQGTGYLCYVFVSVFVFSFGLHCILNGKIYYHVINQNKTLQAIEKERANSLNRERKENNG